MKYGLVRSSTHRSFGTIATIIFRSKGLKECEAQMKRSANATRNLGRNRSIGQTVEYSVVKL